MKKPPSTERLEAVLRSSRLVAGGFMGNDPRTPAEVVEADAAELSRRKLDAKTLAGRMLEITHAATAGLGCWVRIDEDVEARIDEARGSLVCPWPHPGAFAKRTTTLRMRETGLTIRWSDLNIHMIGEHCFFEGKGSDFRIDPGRLADVLFPRSSKS